MPSRPVSRSNASADCSCRAQDSRLRDWCARLRAQGGDEAFVFFKHEETARGVELALAMQALADA